LVGAMTFALMAPVAASAQNFSKGYKFLESVKKKEGQEVTDALAEPGTTVINAQDVTSGETALHIVTSRRDTVWLNFLLSKGADPNIRNTKGETPLVQASNLGYIEGIELLIGKGAKVDDPNSTGETPLINAVHRRDLAMMRILLKAGANPDRNDSSGRSARDYALLDKTGASTGEIDAAAKAKASGPAKSYGPSL
jgi:ankyrin repeat protein